MLKNLHENSQKQLFFGGIINSLKGKKKSPSKKYWIFNFFIPKKMVNIRLNKCDEFNSAFYSNKINKFCLLLKLQFIVN